MKYSYRNYHYCFFRTERKITLEIFIQGLSTNFYQGFLMYLFNSQYKKNNGANKINIKHLYLKTFPGYLRIII